MQTLSLRRCLAVVLLLLTAQPGRAQPQTARLRYRFAAGDTFLVSYSEFSTEHTTLPSERVPSVLITTQESTDIWTIERLTPEGDFVVAVRHVQRRTAFPRSLTLTLTIDFERPVRDSNPRFAATEPNSAGLLDEMEAIRKATVEAFFSRTFTYVISPLGVVKSASGLDEAWDDFRLKLEPLLADKAKRARLDATIAYIETGEGATKSLSRQLFAGLPTEAVSRGHRWSDSVTFDSSIGPYSSTRRFSLTAVSDNGKTFSIDQETKSQPPRATEEVELKVAEDKLTGNIQVNDFDGMSASNNYSGVTEYEAYSRGQSRVLLRKVKREFSGFNHIARREPFIAVLSSFADDAYLRGDFVTAIRLYDQIRKVAPELARVRFYLASSLEGYARQQSRQRKEVDPALSAALELYRELIAKTDNAPDINRVYEWLTLSNLIRLSGRDWLNNPGAADTLTKRRQTAFPAGIEDVLARIGHGTDRETQSMAKAYYDLGNERLNAADRGVATAFYTKAVALDPSFAQGYSARGIAAQLKGDVKAAEADFNRAIEADPRFAPAYANRGSLKDSLGRLDEALEDYDYALALDRSFGGAFNNRGNVKQKKGNLDGALADYKQAMTLDPSLPEPYANSGNVKVAKGDMPGAMGDFTHSLELDPTSATTCADRGRARHLSGDLNGALEDFDRAVSLDPNRPEYIAKRGLVRESRGDLDGAAVDYSKAISIDPQYALAFARRGYVKQQQRDFDGALLDYGRAIELDPKDVISLNSRGLLQEDKGSLDAAVADYTRAIGVDPKKAPAYLNRARALARRGDFTGSIADYNRFLEISPSVLTAQVERGKVKSWSGDSNGALEDFAKVLQQEPTNVDALMNRAFIREARADWNAAIADYTTVIDTESHIFDAYLYRGILRSMQRSFEGALSDFSRARDVKPDDPNADFAMLYVWITQSRLGGRDKATRELRDYVARRTKPDSWPLPIAQVLLGSLSENGLFLAIQSSTIDKDVLKNHFCEAYFFIGVLHLLDKDVGGATELFQRSVDTQATGNSEHRSAGAELRQLTKVPR